MRIGIGKPFCKSNLFHQLKDHFIQFLFIFGQMIRLNRLCNQLRNAHSGIQRSIWILENHLHPHPHIFEFMLRHMRNFFSIEINFSVRRILHSDQRFAKR